MSASSRPSAVPLREAALRGVLCTGVLSLFVARSLPSAGGCLALGVVLVVASAVELTLVRPERGWGVAMFGAAWTWVTASAGLAILLALACSPGRVTSLEAVLELPGLGPCAIAGASFAAPLLVFAVLRALGRGMIYQVYWAWLVGGVAAFFAAGPFTEWQGSGWLDGTTHRVVWALIVVVETLLLGLCCGLAARLAPRLGRKGAPRDEPWLTKGLDLSSGDEPEQDGDRPAGAEAERAAD